MAIGTLATTSVVVGAVLGGATFFRHTPGAWFFGEPGGPLGSVAGGGGPSAVSIILVYGGLLLLLAAWIRLMQLLAAHPGQPVRQVVKTLGLWALPVLVSPPLFSSDVYSYAGQGELVSRHINPYLFGTGVLGGTPFNTMPGPTWANTPSPYGPLILRLDGFLTSAANHQILVTLVLMRLVAVVSLAVIIVALAALARDFGRDPARVVAFGAASPIALITMVGGAHNDIVMVAIVLVGLLVARRHSWVLGIVICAGAASVKIPAALAVVYLGWNWAGAEAGWRIRVWRTALAGVIGTTTLVVISVATGLGMGWISTLNAASQVSTGVTPVATVAHIVAGSAHLVGIPLSYSVMLTVTRGLGMVAAAGYTIWALVESPRKGMMATLGASFLVVALLLPTVWPWYLAWGLMVLAPVAAGWSRQACIWVTAVATLLGAASNKHIWLDLVHASILSDAVVLVGLALAGLAAYRIVVPRRSGSDDRPAGNVEGSGEQAGEAGAHFPVVLGPEPASLSPG